MFRPILIAFAGGLCLLVSAAVATVLPQLHARPSAGIAAGSGAPAPVERMDILQTLRAAKRPRVGELAADFEAKDEIGARYRMAAHRDRPLLFGAFCTCDACRQTAQAWTALLRGHEARFTAAALVALPGGPPLFDFHDRLRLKFPLIPDPEHLLSARYPGPGEAYAALGCPRVWVIGTDGRYRYVMPAGSRPTPDVMRSIARALGLPGGEERQGNGNAG